MQKNNLPDIYLFNPTCEYAIANGTESWQANRILQKMEADLATLLLYFADSTDYVTVNELPAKEFIDHLQKIGIEAPKFILKQNISSNKTDFKINQLKPWGWSPAAHKVLTSVKPNCSDEFKKSPVFTWKPEYKKLYSKSFARQVQRKITQDFPSEHFIAQNQLTEICTTKKDFEVLMEKWGQLMVKAPLSSSGRGLQPIRYKPIHPKVWDKILAMVKDQGYAITEPYLDKVIDLAFQFEMRKGKVNFLGISNFSTDYKGQYNGNSLNGLPDSLDKTVVDFIKSVPALTLKPIKEILEASEFAKNYEGYFGVDTLIFKNSEGVLKVNPCLEINVRYNMGLLCLTLERFIVPNKKGIFRTWFQPGTLFKIFKQEMEQKFPLVLKNSKIESGFFALTPAKNDTQFGAYILV
jgi:hypothetical protein